jgi:hypothetical protein
MARQLKNLKIQMHKNLSEKIKIGTSRHEAKKDYAQKCKNDGTIAKLNESPYVHSISTADNYRTVIDQFSNWIKTEHPEIWESKDLGQVTKDITYEYLQSKEDRGLSAWTISKDMSALNKTLDLNLTKAEGGLRERNIADITRSRAEGSNDKHYNKDNYADQIRLSESFGLRRESVQGGQYALKADVSLFIKDNQVYAGLIEKGGRYREAPCLSKFQAEILEKYNVLERDSLTKEQFKELYNSSNAELLVDKYTTMIDNHAFRSEYAKELYQQLADQKQDLKEDYKGLDKALVLEVSQSLGHNRASVTFFHYLR